MSEEEIHEGSPIQSLTWCDIVQSTCISSHQREQKEIEEEEDGEEEDEEENQLIIRYSSILSAFSKVLRRRASFPSSLSWCHPYRSPISPTK